MSVQEIENIFVKRVWMKLEMDYWISKYVEYSFVIITFIWEVLVVHNTKNWIDTTKDTETILKILLYFRLG